ncbi:MAG: NAD(P) transhydrogenase subunit alpha [Firmicutes bacterium]|nr:NAD(P) transhydrogenase subunit alpha [Bacillota bacterium]
MRSPPSIHYIGRHPPAPRAGGARRKGAESVRWGVPRERRAGERRVALVPETVAALSAGGHEVWVERGAGDGAGHADEAYARQGARLVEREEALGCEAVLKVRAPLPGEETEALVPGAVLVAMLQPLVDPAPAQALARRGVASFSLDLVPRTTRAQAMDVLSAMSTVAGYRAAVDAALLARRFFPMLMTAAGTVAPARVLVLGAGVAGLQAIATCRRLGAVVQAFDARPAVREQVESLGASFLGMPPLETSAEGEGGYARALAADEEAREREFLAEAVSRADVVITTALVPGARAPLLIDEGMVAAMRPGSVIVDLAAEAGGNCALTVPGETVVRSGVTVHGPLDVASAMPAPASQLYARAATAFARHLLAAGVPAPVPDPAPAPPEDPIVAATLLTWGGAVVHDGVRRRLESAEQRGG